MRKWLSAILALALLLSLSACGGKPAPADQEKGAADGENLKKVSLVLDWYPNAVHSFIYMAEKKGYFKEEGLDVEVKMPAENPTDGIRLVGAGKETFALYYQPDVLLARQEGIPIVSVAAVVRHPLNTLMALEGSGINSPKDLQGKAVGYSSISLYVNLVSTMVKSDGGDPAKVRFQDVGWDLIPAITSKQVDAISGGFLNHEKLLLEREGHKVKTFPSTDFGVPNYYELVLITGEQTAETDMETVQAFWRALARGFADVKANPDEALDLLLASQASEAPLDEEIERQSLAILIPLMDDNSEATFGAQSAEDWQKVAQWMTEQGLLSEDVKPEEAFRSVLP